MLKVYIDNKLTFTGDDTLVQQITLSEKGKKASSVNATTEENTGTAEIATVELVDNNSIICSGRLSAQQV